MRLMISVSLGATTYLYPFINDTRNLYKKAADAAAAPACFFFPSLFFFSICFVFVRVGIAHLFVLRTPVCHILGVETSVKFQRVVAISSR